MSDKWARILGIVVLVALAWIGFYWWMSPGAPKISFDAGGPSSAVAKAPPPQPKPKPTLVDLPRPQPRRDASAPSTSTPQPIREPRLAPDPAPPTTAPPVNPPPAVVPPRFNEYKVKVGDTLAGIATMELGNSKFTDAIRRANPFKDLEKLKVGDMIRIPQDPTNIQGKPSSTAPPPEPPADRREETIEYTVQAGDTLSKIAKDLYGSAVYKELILQANKDKLPKNGDALKVGQKLKIPPKPR